MRATRLMESGYRHMRIGSAGLALATMAGLAWPSNAAAEETEPVLTGDCVEWWSEQDEDRALSVRPGLLSLNLGRQERTTLDVGEDSPESGEHESGDSVLSISLPGNISLGGAGALTELTDGDCEPGNDTDGGLVEPHPGHDETTAPDSGDTPQDEFGQNETTNPGHTDAIHSPPISESAAPGTTTAPSPTGHTAAVAGPGAGADGGGPGRVSLDQAPGTAERTPSAQRSAQREEGSTFVAVPHDSRATQDAKAAKAVERLPLLLAILSLVLVAAALVHTWARRTLLR
ncbi:hypothetical protein [Saccharomonospora xinjiangensis]|uniref:hypothetical protein n=1 Tax=Saccharomonospora xinjiangensis TaxID=75294 RepID=UPI001FFC723B|nr:hypothetical protein [Saccharomonospora xinjiangensis]